MWKLHLAARVIVVGVFASVAGVADHVPDHAPGNPKDLASRILGEQRRIGQVRDDLPEEIEAGQIEVL